MAEPQIEEEGIGELLGRLVEDGKGFARAEIGYYRALAIATLRAAGLGIGLGVAAVVLAGSAVTALLVGLILALATLIGPGWATLAVVVATLALAGLLGWLGYRRIGSAFGGKP